LEISPFLGRPLTGFRGLQIAAKIDYVAYAQIVSAANRLGKVTKIASIIEDAARYKILALKGLRQALASFSKDNADGILAAFGGEPGDTEVCPGGCDLPGC